MTFDSRIFYKIKKKPKLSFMRLKAERLGPSLNENHMLRGKSACIISQGPGLMLKFTFEKINFEFLDSCRVSGVNYSIFWKQ